jgi:hypothetical protein
MKVFDLTDQEIRAVNVAFAYWHERWDWEMPTRTGLSREEFELSAAAWSGATSAEAAKSSALAALGAVREVWDAERQAASILGVSPEQLDGLIKRLAEVVENAV